MKKKLKFPDGKVYDIPTTYINIESDYLNGNVEAYCFNTEFDVIIGNVPDAKCACT